MQAISLSQQLNTALTHVTDTMRHAANPKLQDLLQLWADLKALEPVVAAGHETTAVAMLAIIHADYEERASRH